MGRKCTLGKNRLTIIKIPGKVTNPMKALLNSLTLLSFTALFTGVTYADTIIVDDDGGSGVDFTNVQAAIDSASHDDVIIIRQGSYSGFVLDLGLTLLGSEADHSSVITGDVLITGIPNPKKAVLTGLRMQRVALNLNNGHVILDSLIIEPQFTTTAALSVNDSVDVRMYQTTVTIPNTTSPPAGNGVQVVNSRFEAIDSNITGSAGFSSSCSNAGDGAAGLWASGGSILSAFQTECAGGRGGDTSDFCEWQDPYGGDGGDGMYIRGGSSVVVAGPDTNNIAGGDAGYGPCTFGCTNDGSTGFGVYLLGDSSLRHSGVALSSAVAADGSTIDQASPADPYLERLGILQHGSQQTFWVYGTPGDTVTFYLGRAPTITVDPTQVMDDLVSHERAYNLGTIPFSGKKKFTFNIPIWFPEAFTFFVQAATTDSGGNRLLTNSMPIVLRKLP
ncbi:MAG: hypothetical protein ACI8X5_001812 [Planctomycetota bacterium]